MRLQVRAPRTPLITVIAADFGSFRATNRQCPYAIHSKEEARARATNASIPGNIVKVEHLRFCRTGNHFIAVLRNLALGYCCKSKLVSARARRGCYLVTVPFRCLS